MFYGWRKSVPAVFQWQRVREVDPRGSASSARKSVALDPSLASHSVQLIREIGFEGVAMVEYKQPRGGALVLMEINGRPWGSIGLPIACGIDYRGISFNGASTARFHQKIFLIARTLCAAASSAS